MINYQWRIKQTTPANGSKFYIKCRVTGMYLVRSGDSFSPSHYSLNGFFNSSDEADQAIIDWLACVIEARKVVLQNAADDDGC